MIKNEETTIGMISEKVKQFRISKGYSQEKLADKSGISLRTVQRVENGETEPHGDTLIRLAEALKITPDDLLEWNWREDTTYLAVLNLSALSFILFPLLGIILPLVLWITKRKQIKKVDDTGKQLLNFQITWSLVLFFGIFIGYPVWSNYFISTAGNISPSIVTEAFVPFFGFILLLYLYNILLITVNSFRAGKGKTLWYYPRVNIIG